MRKEAGWRHQDRRGAERRSAACRCQKPSDGAAIACQALLAEDEVQPHAGDFDEIAVVQAHGAGDGSAIRFGCFVTWPKLVAVIALLYLRSHLRFEPSLEANVVHAHS